MYLLFAAALIAVDQLSKLWAKDRFLLGGDELELGLGFSFTYVRNTGAAFGILRDLSLPLGPITLEGTRMLGLLSAVVAVALLVFLLRRSRRLDALQVISLTLIFSGATGNMIDRLRLGFVIDFIHFQVGRFDFPVFNVADSCVVIGAALLVLQGLLPKRPAPEEGPQHLRDLKDADFFQKLESEPPPDTP